MVTCLTNLVTIFFNHAGNNARFVCCRKGHISLFSNQVLVSFLVMNRREMLSPLSKNLARIMKYTYFNSLMNWSHKISWIKMTFSARRMWENNLEMACSEYLVDKYTYTSPSKRFPWTYCNSSTKIPPNIYPLNFDLNKEFQLFVLKKP